MFSNIVNFANLMGVSFGTPDTKLVETENGCPALSTTGQACLDFFFKVTQTAEEPLVLQLLEAAWAEDPLTTLKIVGYIRSCYKKIPGQGARKPAHFCYKWLARNHPRTMVHNIMTLIHLGYWGDVKKLCPYSFDNEDIKSEIPEFQQIWDDVLKLWARTIIDIKRRTVTWLSENGVSTIDYLNQPFHDRVPVNPVSKELGSELMKLNQSEGRSLQIYEFLKTGEFKMLTKPPQIEEFGAIKFFPTQKKKNNMIRYQLMQKISDLEGKKITSSMLRTEYLRPAAKMLHFVEEYVTGQLFDLIDYSHIPSKANKRHTTSFKSNDGKRFTEFIEGVKAGKNKMNMSRVHPHEIVSAIHSNPTEVDAWWKAMHNSLDERKIHLDGWVPIIDVSGSMSSSLGNGSACCMDASIGLGILIAERNRGKFNNFVIDFSEVCHLTKLGDSDSLNEKYKTITRNPGLNTNFVNVAQEIITTYKSLSITPDKTDMLINKLVVLTDMEHDNSQVTGGLTSYDKFTHIFKENGFNPPQIIFWNLASRKIHYPTYKGTNNVALISGFSSDILYLLLEDGDLTPMKMMMKALNNEILNSLTIID